MRDRKAIFWDRDGVLNAVYPADGGKVRSPRSFEEFIIVDSAPETLIETRRRGYLNIVVTSQPEISRGLVERHAVQAMHDKLRMLAIDDIVVCEHDGQDGCACRKPKPGMIFEAAKKWGIDTGRSFMVGDTWKDVGAGKAAGCMTILVHCAYNKEVVADFRIGNIREILSVIS